MVGTFKLKFRPTNNTIMKNLKAFLLVLSLTTHSYLFAQGPLFDACQSGDFNSVKKLVEGGADVNAIRADGAPVLSAAMFWPEITQYLIDKGADPNGGTVPALLIAANHYSYEVMEVLLKNGADANKPQIKTTQHPIAMLISMEQAKPKPNKKLIKTWEDQLKAAGGTMEGTQTKTSTLENTINQTNCLKCIELLVANKADVNAKDAVGNDMITNKVVRAPDLLANFKAYGDQLANTYKIKVPSWFADGSREGSHADIVKALINGGADVNYVNPVTGGTPLMAAIGAGNVEAAKVLATNGADVNFITPTKKNALSLSAAIGDVGLLRLLVEKGVDVNVETWELDEVSGQYAKGFTALTIAVMNDHLEAARYLIEAGCKPKEGVGGLQVNQKTNCIYNLKNKTAIYYAVENNNMEMVKMLTDKFKTWNMHEMIMRQPEKSYDIAGTNLKMVSCWKIKTPLSPSLYASKLEFKELNSFLKSKGL